MADVSVQIGGISTGAKSGFDDKDYLSQRELIDRINLESDQRIDEFLEQQAVTALTRYDFGRLKALVLVARDEGY